MKKILFAASLFGTTALLGSCQQQIKLAGPKERAIARFIKGAMADSTTYSPQKLTKDSAFTRRDLLLMSAEREYERLEFDMDDSLDLAKATHDTVAYKRAQARLNEARNKHMRIYLLPPGIRIGDFYTHVFSYETKEGDTETQEVFLRVYDSLNVVKTINGYDLSLL